jgi:hypothetical protein
MLKRGLLLCSTGIFLMGNAAAANIPPALAPYIVDGELKTDNFGWMRGAFDGATAQQKADLDSIAAWSKECTKTRVAEIEAELAAMGVNSTTLGKTAFAPGPCGSVQNYMAMTMATKSWDEFQTNEPRARQIFYAYQFGARVAAQSAPYESSWGTEESWNLMKMAATDQVYRKGLDWKNFEIAPTIEPEIKPYLNAHLVAAMGKEDEENTAKLKKIVEEKGWPSISIVGEGASRSAWLLIQHADHDPAFQLKALRLMEPLAKKGDVTKNNYAYLYDRIMLKLNGKQRFGTQFGCEGEEYKLRPLENEAQLDKLRDNYTLPPIAEYRALMEKYSGSCKRKLMLSY